MNLADMIKMSKKEFIKTVLRAGEHSEEDIKKVDTMKFPRVSKKEKKQLKKDCKLMIEDAKKFI